MGEEQRGFVRVPLPFSAWCRTHGALAETWHPVAILDLSAGGLSFTSESLFESDCDVDVKIQLSTDSQPLILHGMLRRCKIRGTNFTECGLEFVDVTPEQQAKIDELVRFLRKNHA
jgi:c-di-GMP-binding flagellar brake protein YcgR